MSETIILTGNMGTVLEYHKISQNFLPSLTNSVSGHLIETEKWNKYHSTQNNLNEYKII